MPFCSKELLRAVGVVSFLLPFCSVLGQAQQAPIGAPVPRLVQFSGVVKDAPGRPVAGVTFALYKDQEGGTPIWLETQNVPLDESGRYSVLLGSTKAGGLPMELFTSGEARWLGIQPEGQPEQPRVLLLSVPYALKAADAETVGGLPPSAFALAAPSTVSGASTKPAAITAPATSVALAGSGTLDFIPLWTPDGNTLGNSLLFQSTGGNVGINTISPAARLDVGGTAFLRGAVTLPAVTAATSTKGQNSNSLNLLASSFSSTANAPVNQKFRWQVEPTGNNTPTTSGTLNLLFGQGAGIPVETGVVISSTGTVSGNGLSITGQPFNAIIGNAGCNGSFSAALGFPTAGPLNCTNYALLGDTGGNTYLNSTGETFFLNSNTSLAVLDSLGNLTLQGVGTTPGSGNLAVNRGNVTLSNGNVTINGTGHGVTFPDGTTQTTAAAGTGGTGTFSGNNTTQIVSVTQTNTGNAGKAISATTSGAGAVAISGVNTNTNGTGIGVSGGSGNNGTGVSGIVGVLLGNNTGTGTGVSGVSFSSAGTGVSGLGFNGVQGVSSVPSGVGVTGTSSNSSGIAGIFDNTAGGLILSGRVNGVEKFYVDGSGDFFSNGIVKAINVEGISSYVGGIGVFGTNSDDTNAASAGVQGNGGYNGVNGYTPTPLGAGVFGVNVSSSLTGQSRGGAAGVWGDTSTSYDTGVIGTADFGWGVQAFNDSSGPATFFAQNLTNNGTGFLFSVQAPNVINGSGLNGSCIITTSGNLLCTGTKSAVVPVDAGRTVALYAVEAPENWFEDFGSGTLANGVASVTLEPVFAQTVNASVEYHVFLTPQGECEGLYVANKTAAGFEVRELRGGRSGVGFDYRIVARRKGYESIRLADLTDTIERAKGQAEERKAKASAKPVTPPRDFLLRARPNIPSPLPGVQPR
jgi:hypothetical protein